MKNIGVIFSFVSAMVGLFLIDASGASGAVAADLAIFSDELTAVKQLDIIPDDFTGSARLKLANLYGDGKKQIVVSFGNQEKPMIKVYDINGELLSGWQPYAVGFTGEISLSAADLDADGKDEIIAGPGAGGGPQVKIFDGAGAVKFNSGFWAHDQDYRAGIEVAAGDLDGDKVQEVIASVVQGDKALIKFFTGWGKPVGKPIIVDLENNFEPVRVAALDLGTDGIEELFAGLGSGNEPKIKILRLDGSLIKEFLAYDNNFNGGVNFAVAKAKSANMIITGAGFSGGPHVRFFDSFGKITKSPSFFSYDKSFRGGVNVDYGDIDGDGRAELLTLPQQVNSETNEFFHKYIDVDVSDQRLRYYQNGKLVNTFVISSGQRSMPTPYGEYKIWQKNPRAYSNKYKLYMPWWMSFKPGYGLHELPEWPNGYKEGQNHLGKRVSHGCVRLGVGPAKALYDWAAVGTPVIVHE